jgi:hypothetical protein
MLGLMRYAVASVLMTSTFAAGALALAAASPVSPPNGAVVNSAHPVLSWTVPATERSEAIYLATAPETTPEGRFYEENVVTSDLFSNDVREWAPTSALYADTYWWTVRTLNRDTFDSAFSPPVSFTVAAQGKLASVRVRRRSYSFLPDELAISVTWRANVREASIVASLARRGRRIWSVRERESPFEAATTRTTDFTWEKPRRIRAGTRHRLTVTLSFGGRAQSVRRWVRAP